MTDADSSTTSVAPFMKNATDAELNAMNDTARGIVMTLRTTGTGIGEALRERVADLLSPQMLFNKGTAPYPSLWSEMRKFLVDRGVTLRVHQRNRAVYTVANTIFVDEVENATAIELAMRVVNGTIYCDSTLATSTTSNSADAHHSSENEEKTAHNVAMRLKDAEQKFSGDLSQCWLDYRDEYEQVAEDYSLSKEQRFRFLHNILCKDAHWYYLETVKPAAASYEDAVRMLEKEYNSVVRQTRVKNHLSNLRIDYYVRDGVDIAAALAKVYKRILTMSRQVPDSHRGDPHKIEFLHKAVVGHNWAREPLSRIATAGLTFQQLYSELEIAVQLERESLDAAAKSKVLASKSVDDSVVKINYADQGKFVRRKARNGKQGEERKRTCFNCGSDSHLVKRCPHPVNFSRAAASRVRFLRGKNTRNAVHIVLAHLCCELDEPFDGHGTDDDGDEDVTIFEELLVRDVYGEEPDISNSGPDEELEKIEIYSVQILFAPTTDVFLGACIDSGAQRTVIGRRQAEAYMSQVGKDTAMREITRHANKRFRFGDADHECLGILDLRMPVADDIVVTFEAYVVPIDVPLLLGLDILRQLKLIVDFGDGTLLSKHEDWRAKLVHKMGHMYAEWPPSVYYTEAELRRIHRHFYHPSTDKLMGLIHHGADEHITPKLRGQLEHMREMCDTCQRLASDPSRFRVSMPNDDCVFNRTVGMDIMKIHSRSVLHVVDRDTKFAAATFLDGESSEKVWEAFLMCWVAAYVGYPDTVVLDQGSQFQSTEFYSLLLTAGIKRHDAGVESHNALGETERYHAYLRNVYERVQAEHPDLNARVALQLAVKTCNDTAGPAGMVPSLLVFGVVPHMPVHPNELPQQRERMTALHKARTRMATLTAKARLKTAVNHRASNVDAADVKIGDRVLVFRDGPGRWLGPFRVIDVDGKLIHVDDAGRLAQYSIDRCKRYKFENDVVQQLSQDESIANRALREDANLRSEKSVREEQPLLQEGFWDLTSLEDDVPNTFVVRIIPTSDPRAREPDFIAAKKREVEGLKAREVWTKLHEREISADANVLGGVLS